MDGSGSNRNERASYFSERYLVTRLHRHRATQKRPAQLRAKLVFSDDQNCEGAYARARWNISAAEGLPKQVLREGFVPATRRKESVKPSLAAENHRLIKTDQDNGAKDPASGSHEYDQDSSRRTKEEVGFGQPVGQSPPRPTSHL